MAIPNGPKYLVFNRHRDLNLLTSPSIGIVKGHPKVLVLVLGIVKVHPKVLGIGIGFKFLVLSISNVQPKALAICSVL